MLRSARGVADTAEVRAGSGRRDDRVAASCGWSHRRARRKALVASLHVVSPNIFGRTTLAYAPSSSIRTIAAMASRRGSSIGRPRAERLVGAPPGPSTTRQRPYGLALGWTSRSSRRPTGTDDDPGIGNGKASAMDLNRCRSTVNASPTLPGDGSRRSTDPGDLAFVSGDFAA